MRVIRPDNRFVIIPAIAGTSLFVFVMVILLVIAIIKDTMVPELVAGHAILSGVYDYVLLIGGWCSAIVASRLLWLYSQRKFWRSGLNNFEVVNNALLGSMIAVALADSRHLRLLEREIIAEVYNSLALNGATVSHSMVIRQAQRQPFENIWASDYIAFANSKGLFEGYDRTNLRRAMTMVAKADGTISPKEQEIIDYLLQRAN